MKNLKSTTQILSLIAICFFLFIGCGSDNTKTNDSISKNSISTSVPEDAETPEELTQDIKTELAKFRKPFRCSKYSETMELVFFSACQEVIKDGEASNNKNQKLASELKKKVVNFQIKEFPRLRKKYTNNLAEKVWEHDIYVSVQGRKNEIINISNPMFAANKNIQETENTLEKALRKYRFKEIRFRWYKEANEFTSYKLKTPNDKELVIVEYQTTDNSE